MPTRRKFLRDCSLAAAAAGLMPAALAHQPLPNRRSPDELGRSDFYRQLNTRFNVLAGPRIVQLVLVRAAALPGLPPTAGEDSFSLLFHGPVESPLLQETYLFDHPNLGQLPMFIVPVGPPPATHACYEAVFNRPGGAGWISRAPVAAPAG